MNSKLINIEIVGVLPTEDYQQSKYYANYLHKQLPDQFAKPKLRPMFDVQWTEFLKACRRNIGDKFWQLKATVAVFINKGFIGDHTDFEKYCTSFYKFRLFKNFCEFGEYELSQFIDKSERIHVYFTISINGIVVGTLLFQLYIDLVPLTCNNFLQLVNAHSRGYKKAPIHRVVKSSWLQIGGYNLRAHNMPCENYYVPHDKRGVLSTCNRGKHKGNSTQFVISLQKNEWMNYYYVAFGQLIHGEDVLQKIEKVPTYYESPEVPIVIEDCGEYNLHGKLDKKYLKVYKEYLERTKDDMEYKIYPDDISDFRDVDSVYSQNKFGQGLYSLDNNLSNDSDVITNE